MDSEETSSVLSRRGFHGEVGPEVAPSGRRGDWKARKGKHEVKPTGQERQESSGVGTGGSGLGKILLAGSTSAGDHPLPPSTHHSVRCVVGTQ